MALPPRPLNLPELRDRYFELQREFDDHRVAVMLKLRDLEEDIQELKDGERPSQVQVSFSPKEGRYRAHLQAVPAWAVVAIVFCVCLTVAYACSQQPQKASSGPSALESFLSSRVGR